MTIRKQLFISNILIILFAIVSLLFSIFLIGAFLRVAYNNEWQDMKNIDERVYEVMTLMKETDIQNDPMEHIEQLADKCWQYEYVLHVRKNGETFFSELNKQERRAVNALDADRLKTSSGAPRVAQSRNRTVIYDSVNVGDNVYEIMAIGKTSSLRVSTRELIEIAVAIGTILVFAAVVIIILLSRYFSYKMIDRFLVPMQKLIDGAERIKEGNLDEMIYYSGNTEFALVCSAFNDMQDSLRREIEKNAVYEKSRIEMIAGISHDLRTPLTSVRGYIKGMMDGVANTPEKQRQYLTTAYEQAGNMEKLLQQLFLFSRLETGNVPLTLQQVNLCAYLREYIEKNREEFTGRGADICLLSHYEDALVKIDVDQIGRVLYNMIDNSIKYRQKERVQITMSVYKASREVLLSVQDDGAGVAPESLPYIFESYYRSGEGKNRAQEGSGLGLSIVKYIVEAHGGRLLARNRGGLEILIYLKDEQQTADL